MRHRLWLLSWALLIIGVACIIQQGQVGAFWQSRDSNYNIAISSGTTYTGPLDVVSSAWMWGGLRAASTADRGNKLINLCDNAGANCADASSDATTGNLVVTSRGSDACATADDCLIHTIYDRSGSTNCSSAACDLANSTAAKMPTLKHNCVNGTLFCAVCTGANSTVLFNTSNSAQAQPLMFVSFWDRTAVAQSYVLGSLGNTLFGSANAASLAALFLGNSFIQPSASDNSFHSIIGSGNGASSLLAVDGTSTSGNAGTNAINANNLELCASDSAGSSGFTGNVTEIGVWTGTFSGAQITNMCHNARLYWLADGSTC